MKKKNPLLLVLLLVSLAALIGVRFWQLKAPLHPGLISTNDDKRNMALSRLVKLDEPKKREIIPLLQQDLQNPEPHVRRYALYALRKIGSPTEEVMRSVALMLSDPEEPVRQEASVALMEFGLTVSRPALSGLFRAHDKPDAQLNAVKLARQWKEMGTVMVSEVAESLQSPDASVRREAALTLLHYSTETQKATEALIPFITSPVDAEIINALASAGENAKAAAVSLALLMKESPDSLIREDSPRALIAQALEKIDPKKSSLLNYSWDLKKKDAVLRYRAAFALSNSKTLDAGAVPVLVRSLEDKDPYVLGRIALSLKKIGFESLQPVAKTAVPRLEKALNSVSENQVEGFRDVVETGLRRLREFSLSQ